MKKVFSTVLFLVLGLSGMAQENNTLKLTSLSDTIVYVKGRKYVIHEADKKLNIKVFGKTAKGDTIVDDMVYEATYNDEQTTEKRFEFSTPFQKKKRNSFDAHLGGIYMGFAGVTDNFGLGSSDNIDLASTHSWEWGFGFFGGQAQLSKDGHWGMATNFGLGFRRFRLQGNNILIDNNGTTVIEHGNENNTYALSRLEYFFIRIPVCLEWQERLHGKQLFFSGGFESEFRMNVKSRARVNGDMKTLGNDLNANPSAINILLQAGYANLGLYLRCSTSKLFKSDRGPKTYPYSFGVVLYY